MRNRKEYGENNIVTYERGESRKSLQHQKLKLISNMEAIKKNMYIRNQYWLFVSSANF